MPAACFGSSEKVVFAGIGFIPTKLICCRYVPLSPPGFSPYSANCVAMYFAAISLPRNPGPRPSSRSSARNLTCARIFSPSIDASAAFTAGGMDCAISAPERQKTEATTATAKRIFIKLMLLEYDILRHDQSNRIFPPPRGQPLEERTSPYLRRAGRKYFDFDMFIRMVMKRFNVVLAFL